MNCLMHTIWILASIASELQFHLTSKLHNTWKLSCCKWKTLSFCFQYSAFIIKMSKTLLNSALLMLFSMREYSLTESVQTIFILTNFINHLHKRWREGLSDGSARLCPTVEEYHAYQVWNNTASSAGIGDLYNTHILKQFSSPWTA